MSCLSCTFLAKDDDGNYPELVQNEWFVCDKEGNEGFANLKSFPFRKQMPCYQKEFWFTEFAEMISDNEKKNDEAFRLYREKYSRSDG